MPEIGKRIKERRKELNMTQAELAEKLGYKNKTAITKIENGTNDITQTKAIEFAKALDVPIAYLMGWEELNENPVLLGLAEDTLLIETIRSLNPEKKKRLMEYANYLLYQQNENPQDK